MAYSYKTLTEGCRGIRIVSSKPAYTIKPDSVNETKKRNCYIITNAIVNREGSFKVSVFVPWEQIIIRIHTNIFSNNPHKDIR